MKRILLRSLIASLLAVVLCANQCGNKTPTYGIQKNYPASLSKKEVAALAPINSVEALTLTSLDNKTYNVGKGSDKKTVLILFATWCGTCKMAMPAVDSAFSSKKELVNILAVGRGHGTQELKNWVKKSNYSLAVVADSNMAISSKFATQYVPRIYVIDTTGNILHQDFGWGDYMIRDIDDKIK